MGKAKSERRLEDNEAQAHARFVQTSPQKLNSWRSKFVVSRRIKQLPRWHFPSAAPRAT